MPTSPQTSIRAILSVTGLTAVWLAVHQVNANASWFLLAWFFLSAATLLTGRPTLFFWLPLFACMNLLALSFFPWWFPPHPLFVPVGGAIASLIAIFMFSLDRTLAAYRKLETRKGVIFTGFRNSVLGGIYVGLMLGAPVFALSFSMWLLGGTSDLRFVLMYCFRLPIAGAFVGAVLGIGFGFIFDVMVALEFKKRSRARKRGIAT